MLEFESFRLDLQDERLWRHDQAIELRPKTWQVLRQLVALSGQLVTTSQLLDAVWPDVDVTQGTLTQSIAELRRILRDDASHPRFIQTVHGRGYRFIAELRSLSSLQAPQRTAEPHLPPSPALDSRGAWERGFLPGRERELEQLNLLMQETRSGRRQIVFVTGEAGIGKTSVVRTFLEGLTNGKTKDPVWIAGGKCLEFVGEAETYLPVLEAFDRLARVVGPKLFRRAVWDRAPSWLAQMPWLLDADETRETPGFAQGPGQNRMLREFSSAMESLTTEGTVVLWLEDLHWGDAATLDLLAALAERTEPCRLCILVTYRPVEAAMLNHPIAPLKRALLQKKEALELSLGPLNRSDLRAYLERRFVPGLQPAHVDLIFHQSDGVPLFMVTFVNHLVAERLLVQSEPQGSWNLTDSLQSVRASAPDSLTSLVELQLDRMDAETLSALEAGSVEGVTFGCQEIAAAIDRDLDSVERTLGKVAGRGRFLESMGAESWPDGSIGERFRFLHATFRHILYRRLMAGHRQGLHLRIAKRFEQGYQTPSGLLAAKLALHFERGGDPERAVHYLVQAAAGVRQRAGDREAVAYFERALALLANLPGSKERARQELDLRMSLWKEINASGVFSSAEQDASLKRAFELCDQLGDPHCQAYASCCYTRSLIIQCRLDEASAIDERRVETTKRLGDPILLAAAHNEIGDIAFYRGELDRAERELAPCISALEGVGTREICRALGHDPATLAWSRLGAWLHWLQGRPDEARRDAAACLSRAEAFRLPLNRAFALGLCALAEQFRRDVDAAEPLAKSLAELVEEYGFDFPQPLAYTLAGWRLAQRGEIDEAIAPLQEGVAVSHRTRVREGLSLLLAVLAETELLRGNAKEGLAAIEEARAFVEETGERFWEAEIHRLEGELLRLAGDEEPAEACFQKALEVARSQGARALELRAATSLAQFLLDAGRHKAARLVLAPAYDSFTEGHDTEDLRDAKALLDSL